MGMRYASAALALIILGCASNPPTPPFRPDDSKFWTGWNEAAGVLHPLEADLAGCRSIARNGNAAARANTNVTYDSQTVTLPIAADPHLINPYLIAAIGQQQQTRQAYYADIYDCMVAKGYRH
jgi:hypothetical protein